MTFWSRSLIFLGWSGRRLGLPVGPTSVSRWDWDDDVDLVVEVLLLDLDFLDD